jgi:hypothetical protein
VRVGLTPVHWLVFRATTSEEKYDLFPGLKKEMRQNDLFSSKTEENCTKLAI